MREREMREHLEASHKDKISFAVRRLQEDKPRGLDGRGGEHGEYNDLRDSLSASVQEIGPLKTKQILDSASNRSDESIPEHLRNLDSSFYFATAEYEVDSDELGEGLSLKCEEMINAGTEYQNSFDSSQEEEYRKRQELEPVIIEKITDALNACEDDEQRVLVTIRAAQSMNKILADGKRFIAEAEQRLAMVE